MSEIIQLFSEEYKVGDSVSVDLINGKTVQGVIVEIHTNSVVVEKEDGKKVRLFDKMIGSWESHDEKKSTVSQPEDAEVDPALPQSEEVANNDVNEALIESKKSLKSLFNKLHINPQECIDTNATVVNCDENVCDAVLDSGEKVAVNTVLFLGDSSTLMPNARIFSKPVRRDGKFMSNITLQGFQYSDLMRLYISACNDGYPDKAKLILKALWSTPTFSNEKPYLREVYNSIKNAVEKSHKNHTKRAAKAILPSSHEIQPNCEIDRYFSWYKNGAARDNAVSEIRFTDSIVDSSLLQKLQNYKKGDPAIPAICLYKKVGRNYMAEFMVSPGQISELYDIADQFRSEGQVSTADSLVSFLISHGGVREEARKKSQYERYSEARHLRLTHNLDKAEIIFKELISENYQLDTVVKDLADIYREKGERKLAIELVNKHIDQLEDKLRAYNFLSNLYAANGQKQETINALKATLPYLKKTPVKKSKTLSNIALLYISLKNISEAKKYIKSALEANPKNQTARRIQEQLNSNSIDQIESVVGGVETRLPSLVRFDLDNIHYDSVFGNDLLSQKSKLSEMLRNGVADPESVTRDMIAYIRSRCRELIVNGQIDSARDFWIESVQNGINEDEFSASYILSYVFSDPMKVINSSGVGLSQVYSQQLPNDTTKMFNALVKLINSTSRQQEHALYIYENESWRKFAMEYIGLSNKTQEQFVDIMLKHCQLAQEDNKNITKKLQSLTSDKKDYRDIQNEINKLLTIDLLSSRDKAYIDSIKQISLCYTTIKGIDDINFFMEKYEQFQKSIKKVRNDIFAGPTNIAVNYLLQIISRYETWGNEENQYVIASAMPDIKISIVRPATLEKDNCKVQLELQNGVNCTKAMNCYLQVLSHDDKVSRAQAKLQSSLNEGKPEYVELTIKLSEQEIADQRVDVLCSLSYTDINGEKNIREIPLTIAIQKEGDFVEIPNPYLSYARGKAIENKEMFKGRDEIIETMAGNILNGHKSYILYGQKRSGKSSVLHHLKKRLSLEKKYFVCQHAITDIFEKKDEDKQKYIADYLYLLLSSVRTAAIKENKALLRILKAPDYNDMVKNNPIVEFRSYIEKLQDLIVDSLGYESGHIVLLVDEFTSLYAALKDNKISSELMVLWKDLAESGDFTFVFAGHDAMPRFRKDYANALGIFTPEPLDYISPEAARELIEKPIWNHQLNQSRYKDDAISKIIELTACNPFYIQIVCSEVVKYANKNKLTKITSYDVNHVNEMMISSPELLSEADFDNLIPIGDDIKLKTAELIYGIHPNKSREVIRQIAKLTYNTNYCDVRNIKANFSPSELEQIINDLKDRGVIKQEIGSSRIKIKVELYKNYINRNEQESF